MRKYSNVYLHIATRIFAFRIFLYFAVFFTSLGCDGIGAIKINDNFYLTEMDYDKSSRVLSYFVDESFIGVVPAMVSGICVTEKYILVKQHPAERFSEPDTSKSLYYIVPLKGDYLFPEKIVKGPFEWDEFLRQTKSVGINKEIKFREY
jgi:hypothetical protein